MRPLLGLLVVAAAAWSQSISVLSTDELRRLEATVTEHPEDGKAQALLGKNYAFFVYGITALDGYDSVAGVDAAKSESDTAKHAWEVMSGSAPAGVLGEGGQALWNFSTAVQSFDFLHRGRIERNDLYSRGREAGVRAIDRAIDAEPDNGTWRTYRIPILASRVNFKDTLPLTAAEAYAQAGKDIAILKDQLRNYMLGTVATLALKASALDDARSYAQELVARSKDPKDWNYGNAIFQGNMIQGQIAVRQKDIADAKSFLLAAGRTPGSPQLNSFGPNMSLAKDLIEAGERQTVVDFFEQCRVFWKTDHGKLNAWSDQVKAGKTPDFGANLIY